MKTTIGLLLFILFVVGCSCSNEDDNGITELKVVYMESELECFSCINVHNYYCEYIINDEESFNSLDTIRYEGSGCDTVELPEINFNEKTLLGKYVGIVGFCDIDCKKKIEKIESAKKYVYTIEIDTAGMGHCGYVRMNWALVPKLPEDYTVEFNLIII